MPELSRFGAMSIVAHQDDDILFMNPDILASIDAGEANTTIFVTAGDAGMSDAYWMGRETGARAAYSVMTGSDDWVDETVSVATASGSFEIASSYLADHPDIRLYFLRLPDGGGLLAEEDQQQLARLTDGTLDRVLSKDGQSYTRSDVIEVLTGVMELHAPSSLRLQVHEGDTAGAEHTDHIHTSELSEEALSAYDGGVVEVTHYVHYDSRLMPENLTEAEAARSLEVMLAYAEHDNSVLSPSAELAQVYVDWTQRQYIDERYLLDTDTDTRVSTDPDLPPPEPEPEPEPDPMPDPDPDDGEQVWPGAGTWTYTLGGEDAFLYLINPATGEVAPKDWFIPSLDDAWDRNEDHLYELTRTATSPDGAVRATQDLILGTVAEGAQVITFEGVTEGLPTTPPAEEPPVEEPPVEEPPVEEPPVEEPPVEEPPVEEPPVEEPPVEEPPVEEPPVEEPPVEEPPVEESPVEEPPVEEPPVEEPPVEEPPVEEPPVEEPPVEEPPLEEPPVGDVDPGDAAFPQGTVFALGGMDAFLFQIDAETGAITPHAWYIPSLDDAWDRNEDFLHEVTRTAILPDGTRQETEIRLQTTADGVLTPVSAALPDPVAPPPDTPPSDTPDGPPPDPADEAPDTPPSDTPDGPPPDPADETPDTPPSDTPDGPPPDPADETPETPPETPPDDPASPPADVPSGAPVAYFGLSGPDSQLFQIDPDSGQIALRDWFDPPEGDAWDRNEDFLYEIARIGFDANGAEVTRLELRYETLPDGSLALQPTAEDVISMLMVAPEDEDMPPPDDAEEMDVLF